MYVLIIQIFIDGYFFLVYLMSSMQHAVVYQQYMQNVSSNLSNRNIFSLHRRRHYFLCISALLILKLDVLEGSYMLQLSGSVISMAFWQRSHCRHKPLFVLGNKTEKAIFINGYVYITKQNGTKGIDLYGETVHAAVDFHTICILQRFTVDWLQSDPVN